jgi:hypothetical protein
MEELLSRDLISFAPGAVMQKIIQRCCKKKSVYQEASSLPELEGVDIRFLKESAKKNM